MKPLVAIIAVLVGFGSGSSVQVQTPETEQSLFVSVIRRGEPVLDLTADEFVVEEDGERRDILRVERAEAPMHVAILVDDSRGLVRNPSHIEILARTRCPLDHGVAFPERRRRATWTHRLRSRLQKR